MTRPVIDRSTTWANKPKDFKEPDPGTFEEGFQGAAAQPDVNARKFPKASDQNWHMNRTDNALSHILNYGIPVWDVRQEYSKGAKCHFNGIDYICIQDNQGRSPDLNRAEWAFYAPKRMGETFQHYGSSEPIDGWFLNGQRIVNGVNTHPEIASIAYDHALISISGNDLVLADIMDFDRAIGSGSRGVGSLEGDAIRNIWGSLGMRYSALQEPGGAFSGNAADAPGWTVEGNNKGVLTNLLFSASDVVPTSYENRPRNVAYHKCIYHGRYF